MAFVHNALNTPGSRKGTFDELCTQNPASWLQTGERLGRPDAFPASSQQPVETSRRPPAPRQLCRGPPFPEHPRVRPSPGCLFPSALKPCSGLSRGVRRRRAEPPSSWCHSVSPFAPSQPDSRKAP